VEAPIASTRLRNAASCWRGSRYTASGTPAQRGIRRDAVAVDEASDGRARVDVVARRVCARRPVRDLDRGASAELAQVEGDAGVDTMQDGAVVVRQHRADEVAEQPDLCTRQGIGAEHRELPGHRDGVASRRAMRGCQPSG